MSDKTAVKAIDRRRVHEEDAQPPAPMPSIQNISDIIQFAVTKNPSLEMVEKLMDLQERYEKREAEKAFYDAFAEFKKEDIQVIKDKWNAQTKSWYPSIGSLLGTVNPVLSRYGLSARYIIDDKSDPNLITCTCVLSHRLGHSTESEMSSPPDTKGPKGEANKTEIHGRMSTLTYLMKATFSAVTGIAAMDEKHDDDGNKAGGDFISPKQVEELTKLIKEATDDEGKKFLEWLGVETVEEIHTSDYNKAVIMLNQKKAKKVKK